MVTFKYNSSNEIKKEGRGRVVFQLIYVYEKYIKKYAEFVRNLENKKIYQIFIGIVIK